MAYVIEKDGGKITVKTNYVPRDVLYGWDLTEAERAQFDFVDWDRVEAGSDSAEFFRFKGDLYYLESEGTPAFAPGWDAYLSDSFFSGILFRYPVIEPANRYHDVEVDYERVVVATYYVS
jgi:hypothetical protein